MTEPIIGSPTGGVLAPPSSAIPGVPTPTPPGVGTLSPAPSAAPTATEQFFARPKPGGVPAATGTMEWLREHRLDPDELAMSLSPEGAGTRLGLPRFEILQAESDPGAFTDLPKDSFTPPSSRTYEIAKPGEEARLGSISLDIIDQFATANELGRNALGTAGQEGDAIAAFFGARDVDLMSFDIGSRIMDYAAVMGAELMGIDARTLAEMFPQQAERGFWRFQKDPGYWDWMTRATEVEMAGQAASLARSYAGTGPQGAAMTEALIEQFHMDRLLVQGISSGDRGTDYLAIKSRIQGDLASVSGWLTNRLDAMSDAEIRAEMDRFKQVARDNGLTIDPADVDAIFLERRNPYTGLEQASVEWGGTAAFLPIFGTELAEWVSPLDDLQRTYWEWLPADQKQDTFGRASLTRMAADFMSVGAIAIATSPAAVAGLLGRAGMAGANAAKLYQTGYNATLTAAKLTMAAGITRATTNWALSIASPEYYETTGRYVDAARPVSTSALAGVANAAGTFATGSWGVVPAAQIGRRFVGAGLDIAQEAAPVVGRIRPAGILGAAEPAFVRYAMGSAGTIGRMFDEVLPGTQQLQRNAIQRTFLSYALNSGTRARLNVYAAAIRGEATGIPEVDVLPNDPAVRRAWVDQQLLTLDISMHPAAEQLIRIYNAGRRALSTSEVIDDVANQRAKRVQQASRFIDDQVARNYLEDYSTRFGVTLDELRTSLVTRLNQIRAALPERFADTVLDESALGRYLKADPERWRQANSRAHAMLFDIQNSRLDEARRALPSDEGDRIHLMSQTTLTQEDVPDAVLDQLRAGDEDLADRLRAYDEVGMRLERKGKKSAAQLADAIESIRSTLPNKRNLPDGTNPSAALPINVLQAELERDGIFTLGFKPYQDSVGPRTALWEMPVLADGSLAPVADDLVREPYTDPSQVPDGPWRRVVPGEYFPPGTRYTYTLTDGVYVKGVPGTVHTATAATYVAGPGPVLHVNGALKGGDLAQAHDEIEWILTPRSVSIIDATGNQVYAPGRNDLQPSGLTMSGQNAGADWPVVTDGWGIRWLIKTAYPYGTPMPEFVVQADVVATKVFSLTGLESGNTMPFEWEPGVTGTVQRVYENAFPVDPATDWDSLTVEQVRTLQRHHVVDWFVGQHDTNRKSILILSDGTLAAVDKGQAFKFFGKVDAWPPRLSYSPNPETVTDDWFALHGVGQLKRADIEDTIRVIEAIPDDVMEVWLAPLAVAREDAGLGSAHSFIEGMKQRRDSIRQAFDDLYANELMDPQAKAAPTPSAPGAVASTPHLTLKTKGFGGSASTPIKVHDGPDGYVNGPLPDGFDEVTWANVHYGENGHSRVPEPQEEAAVVGMIIREADGRVWVPRSGGQPVMPDRYMGSFNATGMTNQEAAARVAFRTTGMVVEIEAALPDMTSSFDGSITRYYVGRRTGGGPIHAQHMNVDEVALMDPQAARDAFLVGWGAGSLEVQALDAYLAGPAQAHIAAQQAPPLGQAAPAPQGGAPAPPPPPGRSRRYVTYARLPDGEVFTAPWLDYGMEAASNIDLGNRALMGTKMDSLFRTWRSWRIVQFQKANLFRRLTTQYAGITRGQVEALNEMLMDLARSKRTSVQSLGSLTAHEIPVISDWKEQVQEIAVRALGSTVADLRTGEVLRTVDLDWSHIIRTSYQQAYRLNSAAGLTSRFYSIPLVGTTGALVGGVIWPLLKFWASPIFKAGEYAESKLFSLMRGVGPMDPQTMRLYLDVVGPREGARMLATEANYDPALGAMTSGVTGSYTSPHLPRGRPGAFAHFLSHTESGIRAATERARRVLGRPSRTAPVPTLPGVVEWAMSRGWDGDPTLFPTTLPAHAPEWFLKPQIDPVSGQVVLSREVAEADRAAIDAMMPSSWRGTIDERQAAYLARRFALVEQLGLDELDDLLVALPLYHSSDEVWLDAFDPADEVLVRPPADLGKVPQEASKLRPGQLDLLTRGTGSVGDAELRYGMGTTRYASWGTFSTAYGSHHLVLKKDQVLPRDLITTHDRLSVTPGELTPISPAGALGVMRMHALSRLDPDAVTLGDALRTITHHASDPTEHTIEGGIHWSDVEAIWFAHREAADRFLEKVAQIPEGAPHKAAAEAIDVRVVPSTGREGASWEYAWEKAGLMARRDEPWTGIVPAEQQARLVDPDTVTDIALGGLRSTLQRTLQDLDIKPMHKVGMHGVVGVMIKEARAGQAQRLARQVDFLSGAGYEAPSSFDLRADAERVHQLELLAADIQDWTETPGLVARTRAEAQDIIAHAAEHDPAVVAAASAWIDQYAAFEARLSSLRPHGMLRHVLFDDVPLMDTRIELEGRDPWTGQAMPTGVLAEATVPGAGVTEASRVASDREVIRFYQDFLNRNGMPTRHASTGANAYNPPLDAMTSRAGWSIGGQPTLPLTHSLVSRDLRGEIRTAATARLGYDPGEPVINVYLRGEGLEHSMSAGTQPSPGDRAELIITMRGADGRPLGLMPSEMEALWKQHSVAARGLDEYDNGFHSKLLVGWDEAQGGLVWKLHGKGDVNDWLMNADGSFLDAGSTRATRVVFADAFESAGQSYIHLSPAGPRISRVSSVTVVGDQVNGWGWGYILRGDEVSGLYTISDGGTYDHALRDILERRAGKPTTVRLAGEPQLMAWARLVYLGEIDVTGPIMFTNGGTGTPALTMADAQRRIGGADPQHAPAAPGIGLEEDPGTPEWLFSQMRNQLDELLGASRAELAEAMKDARPSSTKRFKEFLRHVWDPVPWKEAQMARLSIDLAGPIVRSLLEEVDHPVLRVLRDEVGVPPGKELEFLMRDRDLERAWLESGRRQDWDALLAHADSYRGRGAATEKQAAIDAFVMSPEWDTVTSLIQVSLRAAQDEAFGVHFFNPYRSTLERSLNHPVLGVYPLSWALKAAREWLRFLFDNRTFGGLGLRLGMAPAIAVSEINRRMSVAVAQEGQSLEEFMDLRGPLGDGFMILSLIMPGDWSSIPFPLSRAIRDALRGVHPAATLEEYLRAGLPRDVDLAAGFLDEAITMFGPREDARPRRERPGPTVPVRYTR